MFDGLGDEFGGEMIGTGNSVNRGSAVLPSEVPPLLQCLALEPVTLCNPKYTRAGELRRVLGVPLGGAPDDHSFGAANPKPLPPVASEELKHYKESVQDTSRMARDRAKLFRESLCKLEKREEVITSKKRQRNDFSLNERSDSAAVAKTGSQIQRNTYDVTNPRLDGRAKSVGSNKRARTSVADVRTDSRSNTVPRQQIIAERSSDMHQDFGGGTFRFEEKIRMLPAGGEGWESKNKKKRSVGAVGSRAINGDREVKRSMHPKMTAEPKLKSCDVQSLRLKSSPGVGGLNKLEGTSDPTNSDTTSIVLRGELENVSLPTDRVALSEQRIVRKGSNKPNVNEDALACSPITTIKAKMSRAPRTGSIMLLDSSLKVNLSSTSLQGSEQPASSNKVPTSALGNDHKRQGSACSPSHAMAQWVGQRPHKNSRMRRANIVTPISNHDETRTSFFGNNGSPLTSSVDNTTPRSTRGLESAASPFGLSESEESGAGGNKSKHKGMDNAEVKLSATQKVGALPLPVKKNTAPRNGITDGVRRQGRTGKASSTGRPAIHQVMEKLENIPTEKPLQNMKSAPDKNKSKTRRPLPKMLKDRKTSPHVGPIVNSNSLDLTGESDDDREELIVAAKAARNAKSHACSGPFWKKMESIFASVSYGDMSYLKQQLGFAEELEDSFTQMPGIDNNILGNGSNEESAKAASLCGRIDVGRLDKGASLYQRVLSAIIEEDDSEEFYIHSEGKNVSLHYASDDSHCGSCNLVDIDPKEKDRMESEVESEVNIQTHKTGFMDRISCDKSVSSNSIRNSSMSSSLNSNGYWLGDDDFSHSDGWHASEICSNDLSQLQMREANVPGFCFPEHQYHLLSLDDRIMLELQSVGLCPETLPDLAEGDMINQDIIELKGGLFQQIGKKKTKLEKLGKALHLGGDAERRKIEQVAMDQLIEMAYRKRLACRGNHTSKTAVRKVSKQVAMAFVKRTLARCRKLENTGSSCFSEPALQELIFSTHPCKNDAKSADCVGSGTASNTCNDISNHCIEVRSGATSERYSAHSNDVNRGKKREAHIDDVIGSASSRVTSTPESNVLEVRGTGSDRDRDQNKVNLGSISNSGGNCPSLGGFKTDSTTKTKPKQKITVLSTSDNGPRGSRNAAANSRNKADEDAGPVSQRNSLQDAFKEDAPIDLQIPDFDSFGLEETNGQQELDFFSNIDDDGHDIMGLEIPMDDLSDVHIVF